MDSRHLGSCLCGAVHFQLDGVFDGFYLCHCAYCRKDTGSAHAANLFSSTGTIEWLAGRDKITSYHLPQTRHARAFCSICGSALPHVAGTMIVVPAGCLDTDLDIAPDAHIFVASKARWEHDLASVPMFDAFPS